MDFVHGYSIWREMALFARTGRPIHAFLAYRWIWEAGLPVPPWFLEYLDLCAERLEKADPKSSKQVAKAFELDRIGRNRSIECDRLAAVQDFWALKERNPDRADKEIFAKVAEPRGVSDRYVEDAYYKWFPKN